MPPAASAPDVFSVAIKVIPSAPVNAVIGRRGEEMVIKINAPPDDGKANRALIDFLAARLNIAKRDIMLIRGAGSRHKIITLPVSARQKFDALCGS